ncbi:LysR family transcriptional regulator [Actinokineospora sp. NPDC004072]
MELEFRHLRILIALADEGSISRAATALGVSQPSLTAQVRRIERALGAPLFERGHTGVAPTGFGRAVLVKARAVMGEMAGLRSAAPPASAAGETALELGCAPGYLAAALVPRLVAAHPRPLRVRVHSEANAADLMARVRCGRLDAALVVEVAGFESEPPDGLLREVVVPVEPVFVALAEHHPLAAQETVDLAALAEENWLVDAYGGPGPIAALRWACGAAGFEPRITHEIGDASSARPFLADGQCVGLAQPTSLEGRGIVVRPLRGDPLVATRFLAWRHPCPVDPALLRRLVAAAYLSLTSHNPSYARWWAAHGPTLV